MAFRFTSPNLSEENRVLKECPVGKIQRETPYIYDAINAHVYAENGCFNPLDAPHYLQQAFAVIGSEKSRLFKMNQESNETKRQSKQGMTIRKNGCV